MRQRWRAFFGTNIPGYRKRRQRARGNALLGLLWGFLLTYVLSEVVLGMYAHLWHRVVAVAGAAVIYIASYLWLLHRYYARHTRPRT